MEEESVDALFHFIDAMVGETEEAPRSTFTSEAQGTVGTADLVTVQATALHDMEAALLTFSETEKANTGSWPLLHECDSH